MSTEPIKSRLRRFSKKLPDVSRDEYYANTLARIDTIIGDSAQSWAMVHKAKDDYDKVEHPKESFYVWLQETYGIKLQFTPDGDLRLANEIIDEKKFLLFTLKYSGK